MGSRPWSYSHWSLLRGHPRRYADFIHIYIEANSFLDPPTPSISASFLPELTHSQHLSVNLNPYTTIAGTPAQPEQSQSGNAVIEGFKALLRTVERTSDAFPPLKGAAAGVMVCIEAFEVSKFHCLLVIHHGLKYDIEDYSKQRRTPWTGDDDWSNYVHHSGPSWWLGIRFFCETPWQSLRVNMMFHCFIVK